MKTEIKGKKVTVVGIGRSGVGAANLISELGAEVILTDRKDKRELGNFMNNIAPDIRRVTGGHPEDIFVSADMIVVSPGVPLDIQPLSVAREKGIQIIGELELAYQIIQSSLIMQNHLPRFLAITGTNGKSTTTTLLDFMLKKGGYRTILGGNIGIALTEEIRRLLKDKKIDIDYIVSEVSSFQLESIRDFRPKGAAILNISPDHLDSYHNIKDYFDAKARIIENQGEGDFLVINADDKALMRVIDEKLEMKGEKPDVFYFSSEKEVDGIYLKDGRVYCNFTEISFINRHSP